MHTFVLALKILHGLDDHLFACHNHMIRKVVDHLLALFEQLKLDLAVRLHPFKLEIIAGLPTFIIQNLPASN